MKATNEQTEPETIITRASLAGNGISGKWSNARLPEIGDRVKITFNGLGTGTVKGFFVEEGWLGVLVQPDEGQRPQWHVDQFKRNGYTFSGYQVFGAEVKFLS